MKNNQKRKILPDIDLNPTILLNWYIGDGSCKKQKDSYNNSGQISCKYYNKYILDQLNNLFGKVSLYKYKTKNGSECCTYHFRVSSFKKFLDYIGECPVESYKYKWITRREKIDLCLGN